MGWVERRPRDVTSQVLEFAETGRLLEGTRGSHDDRRGTIALVVAAAIMLGAGLALAASGALGSGDDTTILVAIICALGALAILVPGVRLLRAAPAAKPIRVRPAAVLPPELVREGNWIHRHGAWLRVQHVGRDGTGRINDLLSSGEVVELTSPTTIAGDEFRPTRDPVAELRR